MRRIVKNMYDSEMKTYGSFGCGLHALQTFDKGENAIILVILF